MVMGVIGAPAPGASVPPVDTRLVAICPLGSVTTSQMVTLFKGAVPQLVTEPETWKEPAERLMACGPQIFATVMQAALVTTVTQVSELAEAGPQGPLPVTEKKSLILPQLVTLMVCEGMATAAWEARLPSGMVIVSTVPSALVMVSVTTTLLRAAEPQFVTAPDTVKEPAARSIPAGPQTLLTCMQAVLVTNVTQV